MEQIQLCPTLTFSRLIQGFWRESQWGFNAQQTNRFIHQLLELGINTMDHAAIYGKFSTEERFGQALKLTPSLRDKLVIVTKFGIMAENPQLPQVKSHYYDNSYQHIIWSANRSLQKLQCDHLDLLLVHRLSPCADPEQIAKAFDELYQQGKVRHFGVSNYTAAKFAMLQSYVNQPLATNQIEMSPLHLSSFDDGTLDFLLEKRIKPMAWSPLAGGRIFADDDKQGQRVVNALLEIGEEKGETRPDVLAYAWLLAHPAKIMPIMGSGKIERAKSAVDALNISFSEEQWLKVYVASQGYDIP